MTVNPNHSQYESFYSKYPHLKNKIQASWGTADCRKILSDSLLSDREGRAGFPPADAKILFNMLRNHDQLFPNHNPDKPGDLPFIIYNTPVRSAYKTQNTGIDLTTLVKVLIVVGVVIGLIKMMIK